MERRRIIVVGIPRSGTSWLALTLSQDRRFTYYLEPDNYSHVAGAETYFSKLYLPARADDRAYRRHMERALNGEVVTAFTMHHSPGPILAVLPRRLRRIGEWFPMLYMRERNVLVKLVRSHLAMDWLQENFPDAHLVYVIRHPCGQFASWKRQGWTPNPRELLESGDLLRDHLAPFVNVLESASTFWEKAGAYWGAVNFVVTRQRKRNPGRIIVQFEWLCEDPVSRFRGLFERLDLCWTPAARRFIEAHDQPDDGTYSARRRSREQIRKWKSEVSPDEVAACRRFAEPFGVPFYPDFEPAPQGPLW